MDTGCLAKAADLIGKLRCHAVLQLRRVDADQGLLPKHSWRSSMYLRLLTAICHHLALKVTARVLQPKASDAGRAQWQSRGCQMGCPCSAQCSTLHSDGQATHPMENARDM